MIKKKKKIKSTHNNFKLKCYDQNVWKILDYLVFEVKPVITLTRALWLKAQLSL